DFKFLSKKLNFNYSEYNSRYLSSYGQTNSDAYQLIEFGIGEFFCTAFDTIVVGDVNTDARIILSTNRFDFGLKDNDLQIYYQQIKYLNGDLGEPNEILKSETKIIYVQNNPWESKYADFKLNSPKKNYLNYTLIRPFGFSNLESNRNISQEEKKLACFQNHPFFGNFMEILVESGIRFKILDDLNYGGPQVLNQYKAFITLSYQVSTMKIYENLLAGVITVVPTPRYLKELIYLPGYERSFINDTFLDGETWYANIEYYSDDLKELFYQFDSIEELKFLLEREEIDPLNVREKGKAYLQSQRIEGLQKWGKILEMRISENALLNLMDE
ncbi:hypothetical protein HK099_002535, partial [Clydaea vesicula]